MKHANGSKPGGCGAALLRGDAVARVHVPAKSGRKKKNTVRQRLRLTRVRTMERNRTPKELHSFRG